uniref:UDP-D-xylose:beta-D-glucoside alpha-1,3-D-xylosyltransferase n=1 Tax=Poecilia latipinna TaxID=48699 RepID=A0A3B3TUD8_9TELE
MRIHCKVVAIAVGFGVFLLVYFFGGNGGADEPPPKEVGGDRQLEEVGRSPPSLLVEYVGSDAVAKLARKSATGVGERRRPEEVMHLAVVACGKRLDETLTMLKSALLFSLKKIKFHIFAEDSLAPEFEERLNQWPQSVSARFQYSIYPISFSVGDAEEWKKLFKPCAAQRLFLPIILKDVDSLLYVDTDVLFLRPMDDIWMFLKSFNGSQLAAMAPEHEVSKIGWYSRFARHPFYGVTGVNSGVMLMNLTRIRRTLFKSSLIAGGLLWEDLLHPLHQKYKNHITWGDQDLLNIIFHYNPEHLYIFPCQWNYRPDHCMYGSNCKGAEQEGVSILHGNRGVYHDDKQPAFKVVYDAIHNVSTGGKNIYIYIFGQKFVSILLYQTKTNLNLKNKLWSNF